MESAGRKKMPMKGLFSTLIKGYKTSFTLSNIYADQVRKA